MHAATAVRCMRCEVLFADGEEFLAHVRDGRCVRRRPWTDVILLVAGGLVAMVAMAGLLELADAANSDPSGAAAWARFALAVAIAVVGGVLATTELKGARRR